MKPDESKAHLYAEKFHAYQESVGKFYSDDVPRHVIEMHFERTRDWSLHHSLAEIENWLAQQKSSCDMLVSKIPLWDCKGWDYNDDTGFIEHASGDFFRVEGLRVQSSSREVGGGWDQPILTQVGDDGGILGLLRKRFLGVPHYLCEVKMEPGNYSIVQLSPTVQATFANIRKAHEGRAPYFLEFFLEKPGESQHQILFDQWLSEDGGRLFNKRNRGILLHVSDETDVKLPNKRFRWLSLYQIKQLLFNNAQVNPHIRGILAHV